MAGIVTFAAGSVLRKEGGLPAPTGRLRMKDANTSWPWAEDGEALRRLALFLDVDGTLLDIADRPGAVVAEGALKDTLWRAASALDDAVALVSGRRVDDLDRIFAPLVFAAAGVHGAQLRRRAQGRVEEPPAPIELASVRPSLEAFVANHPGCLLEDKGVSLAVHFRGSPSAQAPLEALVAKIAHSQPQLKAIAGRMVVELKANGISKGTAVRALMERPPFAGRVPVFAGDDVTDQDGFDAVQALGGYAVQVGDVPGVRAPFRLPDPAAFRTWLGRLVRRIESPVAG